MASTPAYRVGERTIGELNGERRHQVVDRGFTKEKDDELQPHDWVDFIEEYLERVKSGTPEAYRMNLVKVAALAVAAIESYDRTNV